MLEDVWNFVDSLVYPVLQDDLKFLDVLTVVHSEALLEKRRRNIFFH